MRALITGVSGFAGSHLADYLLAHTAFEVWGCDLSGTRRPFHAAALQLRAVDLRDPAAVLALLQEARPDRLYHLAARAFVGDSWANPWETLETNLRGQMNVLEAVRQAQLPTRVLVLGSAEVYGHVPPEALPITEDQPFRPDSPYAVSKVAQDLMGLQYHLSYQLPIVRVRPFNHIGPRQARQFVAPAFAAQIAAIEAGRQPPVLRVGNLAARRDFTDVRDMVRAYHLALEHGVPGAVYNLGTGRAWSIQELLDTLRGFATVPVTVEVDPARLRPVDLPELRCDSQRFQAQTGWTPQIPFAQTLRDLLEYEREEHQKT